MVQQKARQHNISKQSATEVDTVQHKAIRYKSSLYDAAEDQTVQHKSIQYNRSRYGKAEGGVVLLDLSQLLQYKLLLTWLIDKIKGVQIYSLSN